MRRRKALRGNVHGGGWRKGLAVTKKNHRKRGDAPETGRRAKRHGNSSRNETKAKI